MPQIPEYDSTEQYGFTPLQGTNPAGDAAAAGALTTGANQTEAASDALGDRAQQLLYANQARQAENKRLTDAASLDSQSAVQQAQLRLQYAKDPDYQTAPQRFQAELAGQRSALLSGIQDPQTAALVGRNFDQRASSNTIGVMTDAFKNGNASQIASINASTDNYVRVLGGATTPEEFEQNLNMLSAVNAGAVQSGLISPEQQRGMTSKALREALMLRAGSDPAGAQALMNRFAPLLTGQDLVGLTDHLQPAVQRLQGNAEGAAAFAAATGGGGGGGATALPAGPIAGKVTASANARGVDPSVALTIGNIESGLGTVPDRPGSQYQGPFQMGNAAWTARGGTAANRADPDAQVDLGVANVRHSQDVAEAALGSKPQGWQTYLVHQQGDGGGTALLSAPGGASAVDTLTPAYQGNRDAALAAITHNGGTASTTVQQFLQHWQGLYAAKQVGQEGGGAKPYAAGDSLAVGVAQANGLDGNGVTGASPDAVLDNINKLPMTGMAGQPVILSSGVSNDPTKIGVVQQQIDSLKARGVTDIRLVGVGSRFAPLNDQLAAIAQKNGVSFTGPVASGPDGVHPTNYHGLGMNGSDGAAPPRAGGPTYPDDEAAMDRISQIQDPAVQQRALAQYQRLKHQQLAGQAQDRAAMNDRISNVTAGLTAGLDVDVPAEADVRRLYAPAQADQIVDKLGELQQFGQIRRSVDLASPDDIAQMRQQLADGTGALPARLALGGRRGAALTGTAPAAPDGAPDPSGLALRLKQQSLFEQVVAKRNADLAADPAAYVLSRDPSLKPFADAVTANPQDPNAGPQLAQATLAAQQRLGVAQPRLLTNGQAAQIGQRLATVDPEKGDMGAALDGLSKQYGAAWPQVMGELVRVAKVSPEYQTLAAMDQPSQLVARQDLQRVLMLSAQKGGLAQLQADAPPDQVRALKTGLDDTIAPFRTAYAYNPGGTSLIANVRGAVEHLATLYTMQGAGSADALTRAYQGVVGNRWDTSGTMIAPKGQMDAVQTAATQLQGALRPADLAPIPDTTTGLRTDAEQREMAATEAQRASWRPNADASGLVLIRNGRDGSKMPVRRADGSQVELRFNALPPPPAPGPISTIDAMGAQQ